MSGCFFNNLRGDSIRSAQRNEWGFCLRGNSTSGTSQSRRSWVYAWIEIEEQTFVTTIPETMSLFEGHLVDLCWFSFQSWRRWWGSQRMTPRKRYQSLHEGCPWRLHHESSPVDSGNFGHCCRAPMPMQPNLAHYWDYGRWTRPAAFALHYCCGPNWHDEGSLVQNRRPPLKILRRLR
jgi:hypothetical protein